MYDEVLGVTAIATTTLLFAYGISYCFRRRSKQRPIAQELLSDSYWLDSSKEPHFHSFYQTLTSANALLKQWPEMLCEEGVWRHTSNLQQRELVHSMLNLPANDPQLLAITQNQTKARMLFGVHEIIGSVKQELLKPTEFSNVKDSTNHSIAIITEQHLIAHHQSSHQITQLFQNHIQSLVSNRHVKEACILHNLFHLLHQIHQNSVSNKMPAANLATLLFPAFLPKFIKIESQQSLLNTRNMQQHPLTIALSHLIQSDVFNSDFEANIKSGIYNTQIPARKYSLK